MPVFPITPAHFAAAVLMAEGAMLLLAARNLRYQADEIERRAHSLHAQAARSPLARSGRPTNDP